MSSSGRRVPIVGILAVAVVVGVCVVVDPPILVSVGLAVLALIAVSRTSFRYEPPAPGPRNDLVAVVMAEVERSRRYGRQCTLVRVHGVGMAQLDVRRNDDVWDIQDDLMVLLPETGRAGGQIAVTRLLGDIPASGVTLATFPDDALTVHGLLSAVRSPIGALGEPLAGGLPQGAVNGADATIGSR